MPIPGFRYTLRAMDAARTKYQSSDVGACSLWTPRIMIYTTNDGLVAPVFTMSCHLGISNLSEFFMCRA